MYTCIFGMTTVVQGTYISIFPAQPVRAHGAVYLHVGQGYHCDEEEHASIEIFWLNILAV